MPGENVDETKYQRLCSLASKKGLSGWASRRCFDTYRRKMHERAGGSGKFPCHPNTIRSVTGEKCLERAVVLAVGLYMLVRYLLEQGVEVRDMEHVRLRGGQIELRNLQSFIRAKTPAVQLMCPCLHRRDAWQALHGKLVGRPVP